MTPGQPRAATPDDVLVAGAGIAGLALAAALARRGGHARLVDRVADPAPVGGGLQLAPPTVAALTRLGVDPRGCGAVAVRAQEVCDWQDRPVVTMPLTGCTERYGAPYLTVRRHDLHAALLDRARAVADVEAGVPVTAVGRPHDPVVTLASGARREAGLVVGADGIRSVVRRSLCPDAPVFSGLWAHRAVLSPADLPRSTRRRWTGEPVVRLWLGPGSHVVAYPMAEGAELNVVLVLRAGRDAPGPESWTAASDPGLLARHFRGWGAGVRDLVEAVTTARGHAVHDRDPTPRLAEGRLALVGDAAHPMAPFLAQGANQAVEGAVELAAAVLGGGEDDLATRLQRYSRLRTARASALQGGSRAAVTQLHLPDGPGRAERDRAWRAGGRLAGRDAAYGYPVARLVGNAVASTA